MLHVYAAMATVLAVPDSRAEHVTSVSPGCMVTIARELAPAQVPVYVVTADKAMVHVFALRDIQVQLATHPYS